MYKVTVSAKTVVILCAAPGAAGRIRPLAA